jgi:hypothetical protein
VASTAAYSLTCDHREAVANLLMLFMNHSSLTSTSLEKQLSGKENLIGVCTAPRFAKVVKSSTFAVISICYGWPSWTCIDRHLPDRSIPHPPAAAGQCFAGPRAPANRVKMEQYTP